MEILVLRSHLCAWFNKLFLFFQMCISYFPTGILIWEIVGNIFTSTYLVFLSYFMCLTLCEHGIEGAVLFFQLLKYWMAGIINFVWLYHIVTPGLFFCNEKGKIFSLQCIRTSHLLFFLIFFPLPFKLEVTPLPWKCVSFSVGLQISQSLRLAAVILLYPFFFNP